MHIDRALEHAHAIKIDGRGYRVVSYAREEECLADSVVTVVCWDTGNERDIPVSDILHKQAEIFELSPLKYSA